MIGVFPEVSRSHTHRPLDSIGPVLQLNLRTVCLKNEVELNATVQTKFLLHMCSVKSSIIIILVTVIILLLSLM